MTDAPTGQPPPPDPPGALSGVRVLDLTDERAIYGAKLIADLGADVVRPEPPSGDPLRERGPFAGGEPGPGRSLWYAYFASGRRSLTLDPEAPAGRTRLRELARAADVVLDNGALARAGIDAEGLLAERPGIVVVRSTSFGREGPWRDYRAPDLVASALGGICATTGDADTPPLKLFGELAFMISGAYVAIGALAALHHARETGAGQIVDAAVHEALPTALEHVLMYAWYCDLVEWAETPVLPRQGALHWTTVYQVLQAQGGGIMVTPTPDPEAQLAWLVEEGFVEDLLDPKWQDPDLWVEYVRRLMDVMRAWVPTKEVGALFEEAQARHAPYGRVLPPELLLDNPQLEARGWWRPRTIAGAAVRGPGGPYRFERTPWRAADEAAAAPGAGPPATPEALLSAIGWDDR